MSKVRVDDGRVAEVDRRLRDALDDSLTPGAPGALFDFLAHVPEVAAMTEPEPWWRRIRSISLAGRLAAAAAVAAVALVGVGLAMGLPGSVAPGASAGAPPSFPPIPSAPAGWQMHDSFASGGPDGIGTSATFPEMESRIALHVVCNGPSEVLVLAYPGDAPTESAGTGRLFVCDARDQRLVLESAAGFRSVYAVALRRPDTLRDTVFRVSVEVPVAAPSPSASGR